MLCKTIKFRDAYGKELPRSLTPELFNWLLGTPNWMLAVGNQLILPGFEKFFRYDDGLVAIHRWTLEK